MDGGTLPLTMSVFFPPCSEQQDVTVAAGTDQQDSIGNQTFPVRQDMPTWGETSQLSPLVKPHLQHLAGEFTMHVLSR